jgi:ABC-type nitrate/sulfonate/bicarbonate transport system substrate-binding protein
MSGLQQTSARRERRNSHRAGRFGAATAVAGVLALAGSSSAIASTSHVRAKAAALTNLTIGYAAPSADQMLVEVANNAGIFKKYGINANVEFLQQSLLFPAMVSGQVQFGVAAAPGPEITALGGNPLEYLGQWENANDVEIIAGPKIGSSPSSANGKSIAISSDGSLSDFTVHLYDQKYNTKMTEVPLGNLTNDDAAFSSGSVNALAGVSPWQVAPFESQVAGTHVLENFATLKGYPAMGVIADSKYASTHSAITVKVLEAFIQAAKYWKTHSAPAIAAIAQYTSEPTAEATQAYHAVTALMMPNLTPLLQDQKNILKALVGFGYPAASSFNAKQLQNTTYVAKAYKALAPKKRKK